MVRGLPGIIDAPVGSFLRDSTSEESRMRRGSEDPGKRRTMGISSLSSMIRTYDGGYMWLWISTTGSAGSLSIVGLMNE